MCRGWGHRSVVYTNNFSAIPPGLYAFRTALLYEVDKDASIGKRNVIGKMS